MFAIGHLRVLLRGMSEPSEACWTIPTLVQQLSYDGQNGEVALAALAVLEEACAASSYCLEECIKRKPSFKVVGVHGQQLQMQFLASKAGVEFLNSARWIEPQIAQWRSGGGNQRYVDQLEYALVAALNTGAGAVDSGAVSSAQPAHKQTPTTPRSESDDYFFRRVHALPFTIDLSVEHPQGRKVCASSLTIAVAHDSLVCLSPC